MKTRLGQGRLKGEMRNIQVRIIEEGDVSFFTCAIVL